MNPERTYSEIKKRAEELAELEKLHHMDGVSSAI